MAPRSNKTGKSLPIKKPSHTAARSNAVRVVGIGASAGGLEALEAFFGAMPADSGLAFAIVQHLSPDFRSMMDELLSRHSRMRIQHALNGMEIESNTVYLNPPRQNLVIRHGKLFLTQPDPSEQPNHPIDAFFTSLALDRGELAIGIILSGTGSDGTKGAKSIIGAGGAVLVQEPESAKFENMPRSAIEHGAYTAKGAPNDLPVILSNVVRGDAFPEANSDGPILQDPEAEILRLLERRFGTSFSYYKRNMITRRFNRRANLGGLQDLTNYASRLRGDPEELERLYADLLIGVTAFFRDRAAFTSLERHAMTRMARLMSEDRPVRIWVPGCATGEEAYSIAIQLSECARKNQQPINLKIFATDLHHGSLQTAATGLYSTKAVSELSDELRSRYFDRVGNKYQVKASLRALVVFSPHNVLKDPPFTRIDLISCRNLLIYFDEVAQAKVLNLFHFSLNLDGLLFLGPSETLGQLNEEFESLDGRWRIFRKLRDALLPGATRLLPVVKNLERPIVYRSKGFDVGAAPRWSRSDRRYLYRAYDLVLERYAPPCLLISESGEILHVFGSAHTFLSWRPGAFSGRLVDAVIPELRSAIATALSSAWADRSVPVSCATKYSDGLQGQVSLTIRAEILSDDQNSQTYGLITFSQRKARRSTSLDREIVPQTDTPAVLGRVEELERSLSSSEEDLQTTNEELETANEELQSTNEELMSANEELQSTNEELHAVNEELYSVSTEHRRKIDELVTLTNDMDHLLKCTDVGTIFLDSDLNVRRFTPAAARTFNLLDRDIGRPIKHITTRFTYPEFLADIADAAAAGKSSELAFDVGDEHYLLRITPYNIANAANGVILTIIDVPQLKKAERALELRNQELARLNGSLEQFTYIVAHDLRAPLRTILNSAKWIEEDLGDGASEEVRNHCNRLMTYAHRLTDMLTDLMVYAKLGKDDAAVEEIEVDGLVREIVQTIDADNRVALRIEGDLKKFRGRKVPLQLVFQNLIDNALKYSDRDQVSVTVNAEETADRLKFSVSDDGPGINPRYHDRIFLPFRKLEHSDKKAGTGMGLALVKNAVEENGGSIEVISNPPHLRGTAFSFTWSKLNPSAVQQLT
jgi:two-component system, chemotaxis family, CheB/CheR fusion protein